MREKMRENLDKSSASEFDLKQGRGGITDIEFMVQYCLLQHAHQIPEICYYSDNIRQLEALQQHQLMDENAADRLSGIYRTLRAAQHRLALQEKPALVSQDVLAEERNIIIENWYKVMNIKE
jgi:glutamate-ammonia-ligase adenylyltransferase